MAPSLFSLKPPLRKNLFRQPKTDPTDTAPQPSRSSLTSYWAVVKDQTSLEARWFPARSVIPVVIVIL